MALQVLIAGVNRLGYLERGSLRINQDAATYVSTCHLNLIDPNNIITAVIKDTIVVQDPVLAPFPLIYFDGTVANVDYDPLGGGDSPRRRVKLQCQDNNILVEEAIVVGPHGYVAVADNVIIAALFALYAPGFDAATNVNVVDGAVTIDFQNITLREAMRQLCNQTDAFWFVRALDLYYGVEADFGLVPWDLSDTPDNINSFEYLRDTARKYHGSNMVNEITVIGILAAAGGVTRQDAASIAAYGTHAAITTDNRISTVAGATKRGDAILSDWSMPRESYTVKTFPGIRTAIAGQRIRYINSVYGINAVYTIRRLNITFPYDTVLYTMTLGDDLDLGLLGQRIFLDKIEEALEPITPGDLPLSSMGWSHDIDFAPTADDIVEWGAGTLTSADGTAFAIVLGTTGNMVPATPRYVYLDTTISIVALQVNDVAANAVGPNRVLIAVCFPSADAAIDAVVQVFGGAGDDAGIFINADNIAATCITANEIHANAINAGHIQADAVTAIKILAGSITTPKIDAGAVTADKLSIGEMFFNSVDGLILLGPHGEVNPPTAALDDGEWWTTRHQIASVRGAFQQVAGRWIDTRALRVERATTNLCENPSFETGVAGWAGGSAAIAQSSDYFRFGDDSCEVATNNAAAFEGAHYLCTGTTAANTAYTFSCWVRSEEIGTVRIGSWDDVTGYQWGAIYNLRPQWTRLHVNLTFGVASTVRYLQFRTDVQQNITFYIDGAQIEVLSFLTTYCDGSLGIGFTWTGAAHASTSTRADAQISLSPFTRLLLDNTEYSFRVLAQMPQAHDGDWPTGGNYLLDVRGLNDANRVIVAYDSAAETFKGFTNGLWRLESAVQTFEQGDWIDFVVTYDWANDDYNLYVNGILEDNDTTVLAVPLVTNWRLGGKNDGTFADTPGAAFCEHALFDIVLSAVQVAQMYNLQRPLVDSGATDSPGIYIYDGSFRIASSTTGNRIEITAEEIAGYDSAGVKQFYLQSSDGVAVAGAGDVTLGADGIQIALAGAKNAIEWLEGATVRASVNTTLAFGHPGMRILAGPPALANDSSAVYLTAKASGASRDTILSIRSEDTVQSGRFQIEIGGPDGYIDIDIDGVGVANLSSSRFLLHGDIRLDGGMIIGDTVDVPSDDDLRVVGGIQVGESDIHPAPACILFQGKGFAPGAPADGLYLYHYTGGGRNALYAMWSDGVTVEIVNHP